MTLNEPSVDFHLKLQEGSFKIPYEAIRRNFKSVQKLDEKQFKKLDELYKDFNKATTKKEKLIKLKQVITSLKQFEKKIQTKVKIENELVSRIQHRLDKLNELKELKQLSISDEKNGVNAINQDKLLNWYRDQTNLLIADYLLKNSHLIDQNPGLLLIKTLGFEKLIDSDIILVSNRISTSILNKNLDNLIHWIDENKSHLKKIKSNLEFETRFQEYIELIKQNEMNNAIKLFNTHLSQFTKSNFNEIKLASGLLIFAKKAQLHPNSSNFTKYNTLLSSKRYTYLSDLFLKIYYKMHGISEDDPLLIYLSLGISALKTRSCQCNPISKPLNFESILNKKLSTGKEDLNNPSNICPICSLEFNQLSSQLPYSHNVKSYLFDNPVMLPNGNIYDKEKLVNFSKNLTILNENEVKDPVTTEIYTVDDLVTMYPT